MSFITELKRRNVFKVAVAYLISAWLGLQLADIVLEAIEAPLWVMQALMLLLIIGFVISVLVAWIYELTPEGIKREKDVDRTRSITTSTGRKLNFTIIAILLVAVVFLLADRFIGFGQNVEPPQETAEISETEEPSGNDDNSVSIAVLPFVNMSSDQDQEYFSDGITEEILNSLARVKELKVAGRTSSFAFKGQNQDLRKIGNMLGVDHILEGSVRKAGNTVRITAQLIQVEDGFHLWSDTYDRELTDVFAIQDQIAGSILEELKAQLLFDEQFAVESTPTEAEVYDLYLLSRQRIYERTRPAIEDAVAMLDKAIAMDPGYAPVYAQRGIAALLLADEQYGVTPRTEANAEAIAFLEKALELDPELPEALAGMGLLYSNVPGKNQDAIDILEQALEINPNLINARNWIQVAYSNTGRIEDSVRSMEELLELDPLYRPGIANLSRVYLFKEEFEKVEAIIDRVRPFMPNDPFLLRIEANVQFAKGRPAAGLVLIERALEVQPDNGPNLELQGGGLLDTAQWERAAELGTPEQRFTALWRLGRIEEATMLARQQADSGESIGLIIAILANSDDPARAVRYFEERWDSFDEFEADYPLESGTVGSMLDLAYAYGYSGNEALFSDAMERAGRVIDYIQSLGFSDPGMLFFHGVYHAMLGDRDRALVLMSTAIDRGHIEGDKMSFFWHGLRVLEGDPEYQAIEARMIEHLNEERAQLNLEPLSI